MDGLKQENYRDANQADIYIPEEGGPLHPAVDGTP